MKDREVLSRVIKSWAQEHDLNYTIASSEDGDDGIDETGVFLTWLIKQQPNASIDLLSLLDRMELYVNNIHRKSNSAGVTCYRCKNPHPYAEANQADGTFLCYSCRSSPYT